MGSKHAALAILAEPVKKGFCSWCEVTNMKLEDFCDMMEAMRIDDD
jgi:hypothetical protein